MTVTRQILFIQGGGAGAHDEWDDKLVESLRRELGTEYEVRYPRMPDEGDPSYARWSGAIRRAMADAEFAAKAKELTKLGVQVELLSPKALEKLGQLNQLSGAGNPTGPGGGERHPDDPADRRRAAAAQSGRGIGQRPALRAPRQFSDSASACRRAFPDSTDDPTATPNHDRRARPAPRRAPALSRRSRSKTS